MDIIIYTSEMQFSAHKYNWVVEKIREFSVPSSLQMQRCKKHNWYRIGSRSVAHASHFLRRNALLITNHTLKIICVLALFPERKCRHYHTYSWDGC